MALLAAAAEKPEIGNTRLDSLPQRAHTVYGEPTCGMDAECAP